MAAVGACVFKEKIRIHHIIGCLMLITCASIISLSDEGGSSVVNILGKEVEKIPAIYAVLMALVCPFTFTA